MKSAIRILCCVFLFISNAKADSYMDLITTPPEGWEEESSRVQPSVGVSSYQVRQPIQSDLWYDSRIKTKSPVVMSSYPKYLAWVRAQTESNYYDYTHDYMQNLIYATEAGLLGWGIYELYHSH